MSADDPDVIARLRARRIRAERQKLVKPLLICGIVAFVLLLFAFRPTPILGVDGKSLQYSFDVSSFNQGTTETCEPRTGKGQWKCFVYDDSDSKEVPYKVSVDRMGCWTGTTSASKKSDSIEPEISGCITILDHLRLRAALG